MTISTKKYPKVLLVHLTKVHQKDAVNLMLRNLFGDWPKENLAQIYTGDYRGTGDFCGHYFKIGIKERRLGWLFHALKPMGMEALSGYSLSNEIAKVRVSRVQRWIANVVSNFVALGYWEVLFNVRSSDALLEFIHEFKPEILYTQGYSLNLTRLSLEIAERLKIPICYFPMDDWHSSLYEGSYLHRHVEEIATRVAQNASVRFALGPKMAETLTSRYNVLFECLYHADSPERFNVSRDPKNSTRNEFVVGYVGSLYLGRSSAIQDLLKACALINYPFRIEVYCENIPTDIPQELISSPAVVFLPLPDHNQLPGVLVNCDMLFLPESFESKYKSAIELSLSTKAHLYMFSRRPIVVYGPPWSGTVDYAKRFGWGIVIEQQDIQLLAEGIKAAFSSQAKDFVQKAYNTALLNHDIKKLRAKVHKEITATVWGNER